jgi:hypothetical protein
MFLKNNYSQATGLVCGNEINLLYEGDIMMNDIQH